MSISRAATVDGFRHRTQGSGERLMVMLSSALPNEAKERYRWRTPRKAGGITMGVCAVNVDADAHYQRAKAAGAEIVTELHDNQGYPGRSYNATRSPWERLGLRHLQSVELRE